MVVACDGGRASIFDWTVDDVRVKLASCRWAEPGFRQKLRVHKVDGMALAELTKEDLRDDFRIGELGTIKALLRNITRLKDPAAGHSVDPPHGKDRGTAATAAAEPQPAAAATKRARPSSGKARGGLPHHKRLSEETPLFTQRKPLDRAASAHAVRHLPAKRPLDAGAKAPAASAAPPPAPPPLSPATQCPVPVAGGGFDAQVEDRPVSANTRSISRTVSKSLARGGNECEGDRGGGGGGGGLRSGRNPVDSGGQAGAAAPAAATAKSALPQCPPTRLSGLSRVKNEPRRVNEKADDGGGGSSPGPPLPEAARRLPPGGPERPAAEGGELPAAGLCTRPGNAPLASDACIKRSIAGGKGDRAALDDGRYRPGILELERRHSEMAALFHLWQAGAGVGPAASRGSGFIEYHEFRALLHEAHTRRAGADPRGLEEADIAFDANGDSRIDQDEFHRFVSEATWDKPPTLFDELMYDIRSTVTEAARAAEAARREANLELVFQQWDRDRSGYIEVDELYTVLTRYNDLTTQQGMHTAQVLMGRRDADGDGRLGLHEFLRMFKEKTQRLRPDEFDFMIFRVRRCLEDLLEDSQAGLEDTFKPLTESDLASYYVRSAPPEPIILYGRTVDPAMQIEHFAARNARSVRSFMVQHGKSEKTALKELVRWGVGRGHWIYVTVDEGYANRDGFLRAVGVALKQRPAYLIHRKFRLWVMVNTARYAVVPWILKLNAVPVPLDQIRLEKVEKARQ
ncbi:Calcineurin subunit B [Diplonema papillatum]|nr:Calcineurin subunit B [Diplonema papillatum]